MPAINRSPNGTTSSSSGSSNLSRNGMPKRRVEFAQDVIGGEGGGDSGIDDGPDFGGQPSLTLSRPEVRQQTVGFCVQMRQVIRLVIRFDRHLRQISADHHHHHQQQQPDDGDLSQHARRKIHPRIVYLDEKIDEWRQSIRLNVDRCRISDDRTLEWLLRYNSFMVQLQQCLRDSCSLIDQLDRYLQLSSRGVCGLSLPNQSNSEWLMQIVQSFTEVERALQADR